MNAGSTPAGGERPGGQLGGLAGADDDDQPARQVAERRWASSHRHRGHRHPALGDRRLRAGPLPGRQRPAEQPVEDRPGGALDQGELVGPLHLALDLRLAEDHRVEARR